MKWLWVLHLCCGCLPASLPARLRVCLFPCLPACLPACQPACLPACLPASLPVRLPVACICSHLCHLRSPPTKPTARASPQPPGSCWRGASRRPSSWSGSQRSSRACSCCSEGSLPLWVCRRGWLRPDDDFVRRCLEAGCKARAPARACALPACARERARARPPPPPTAPPTPSSTHPAGPHPCRRLKAEVDRQRAPPALRLLDELMGILDPGEGACVPWNESINRLIDQSTKSTKSINQPTSYIWKAGQPACLPACRPPATWQAEAEMSPPLLRARCAGWYGNLRRNCFALRGFACRRAVAGRAAGQRRRPVGGG